MAVSSPKDAADEIPSNTLSASSAVVLKSGAENEISEVTKPLSASAAASSKSGKSGISGAEKDATQPLSTSNTQPRAVYLNNVLTHSLEQLEKKKQVRLYGTGFNACVPAHIGIASLYVGIDVLIRYLEFLGYEVQYVRPMNDLYEDFIVLDHVPWDEQLPKYYCNVLEEDLRSINCRSPELAPRLSESSIIRQLEKIPKFHEKDFRNDHFFSAITNKESYDIHGDWTRGSDDQSNLRQIDDSTIKYKVGCAPIEFVTKLVAKDTLTVGNLIEVHNFDPLCVRFFLLYKRQFQDFQLSETILLKEVAVLSQRLLKLYKALETSSAQLSKLQKTCVVSHHFSVEAQALQEFRSAYKDMEQNWNNPEILIHALLEAQNNLEVCLRFVEVSKAGLVQPLVELRNDMVSMMNILGLLPSNKSITQVVADIERCTAKGQMDKLNEEILRREEIFRRQEAEAQSQRLLEPLQPYPELLEPSQARTNLVTADHSPPPPLLAPLVLVITGLVLIVD